MRVSEGGEERSQIWNRVIKRVDSTMKKKSKLGGIVGKKKKVMRIHKSEINLTSIIIQKYIIKDILTN